MIIFLLNCSEPLDQHSMVSDASFEASNSLRNMRGSRSQAILMCCWWRIIWALFCLYALYFYLLGQIAPITKEKLWVGGNLWTKLFNGSGSMDYQILVWLRVRFEPNTILHGSRPLTQQELKLMRTFGCVYIYIYFYIVFLAKRQSTEQFWQEGNCSENVTSTIISSRWKRLYVLLFCCLQHEQQFELALCLDRFMQSIIFEIKINVGGNGITFVQIETLSWINFSTICICVIICTIYLIVMISFNTIN